MASLFRSGSPSLFSARIEPCCSYCAHGTLTQDGGAILCIRNGVVLPNYSCKRFTYDPISRKVRPKVFKHSHSAEDFSL